MDNKRELSDEESVRLAKVERRLLVPGALKLGYEIQDKIHVILLRDYPGVQIPAITQSWGGVVVTATDGSGVTVDLVCLNVAPRAVANFQLHLDDSEAENSFMSFRGRFGGVEQDVLIPLSAIMQISYPGHHYFDFAFSSVPAVMTATAVLGEVTRVEAVEKPKASHLRVVK